MTDTAVELETVEPVEKDLSGPPVPVSDEQLVAMLVERARSEGLQLTGRGGLLQQLTKRVLESALEGEVTDHLGYEKHESAGRGSGNSCNGGRAKTVLTDVGPVEIKVPRDVSGTFEPQIISGRSAGHFNSNRPGTFTRVTRRTLAGTARAAPGELKRGLRHEP